MAEKTVTIEEHSAYVDIQDDTGKVIRYFPITRILDVIGAEELSLKQRDALKRVMSNPYIAGTNEDGEPTMYRLEVSNGSLYISDEVNVETGSTASIDAFTDYMTTVSKLFNKE